MLVIKIIGVLLIVVVICGLAAFAHSISTAILEEELFNEDEE